MNNGLLNATTSTYKTGHIDGQRLGQQQIIDATMIYFARKGFAREEAVKYFKEVNEILEYYIPAYMPSQEQDIWQERMDDELRAILGDDGFEPFCVRNPTIKTLGYDKAIKEQRHPATKKHKKKR